MNIHTQQYVYIHIYIVFFFAPASDGLPWHKHMYILYTKICIYHTHKYAHFIHISMYTVNIHAAYL